MGLTLRAEQRSTASRASTTPTLYRITKHEFADVFQLTATDSANVTLKSFIEARYTKQSEERGAVHVSELS
jgi:hypothetical protein